ncbi:M48 family metallopeptidase [Variovorax dokdonensis]|uniref:M48 family metallopeptidase n=1 Tax=Variovorax dokdonensis TaxID=344883 RepID=A0ABT7N6H0_9BURK|nr:M48 family metallopeptidase [Variovorax dokdonensis]MDM0043475.1 M48 family metallopeptidase [Variovorax dokdonensis]
MDRADFVHLVRLSEHDSADDSARYRRGVALFAALGYAWVISCLALALGVLAWVAMPMGSARFSFARGWAAVFALGLLWATLRALWVRFDPPEGVPLKREDAPRLFEALDRIRERIDGPPVHHVYLDNDFNASIRQVPRFGFLGGAVNHLNIGLPLLMALDRRRLLSVLAHEYGHLRGNHGRLSAWIYRTRLSWLKLDESLQRSEGVMALASRAFFTWYFPRFAAKTFALARQDEYEADRVSARLLGTGVAAAALTEIAVKGHWYSEQFWATHWARAANEPEPVGPFAGLLVQLRAAPEAAFARDALRKALRQVSDVDDTHPVLRDRLEAFEEKAGLPEWSVKPALHMFADKGERWIKHFDRQWCTEHASDWRQHSQHLARVRERVQALAESQGRNNADEMVEWADLQRHLDVNADVRDRYERALALTPEHTGALRGYVQMLPPLDRASRLPVLERLHEAGSGSRWWAAKSAVELLENPESGPHDEVALKLWRGRLRDAEEAERRAWDELTDTPFFSQIAHHDLSDFEAGELRVDLARCQPVARAWLVRKNLHEFPWRRAYILFLDLPTLADDERYSLCRHLEQTLSLPGVALVLWAGNSPTAQDIERHVKHPFWQRSAR